ncbi:hypothetical protein K1T71_005446 [Dendrolimus kikuchii]|uniref:Uncharacterized protein n=1 Tax=Dendrolimus kikuchii TaxID=765133 RepID=A0ACC1D4C3_9NEOP|nr:hypothetical protein K1T71_005446 [Dendrolimus kikuchii]
MPNTRRRKFSVKNAIGGRDSSKLQNGLQNGHADREADLKIMTQQLGLTRSKMKNKLHQNNSKTSSTLEIVAECSSNNSIQTIMELSTQTLDKDVTASSSTIDLCHIIDNKEDIFNNEVRETTDMAKDTAAKKRDARNINTDQVQTRRDKHPRQHRIKVRSPKRRPLVLENKAKENIKRSIGTSSLDWDEELEVSLSLDTDLVPTAVVITENEDRASDHSLEDMCRICHGGGGLTAELGQLISACACRGTVGMVHVKCLERWLTESGKSRCELCGTRYATRRLHRYGVPRALVMWVLSQNAKQLMVDSLGIMLMSPLAVLAAWLSGRTLAGLMTQDSHVTPWPLASTFVLACMTLVCYYCWIVSAATRHALGWWMWYRSQYEVRLQFDDSEE